jgi:hypothetical protein
MPVALALGPEEQERASARDLAICDVSAFRRLGLSGPGTVLWLSAHGVAAPDPVYNATELPGGGQVIRTGIQDVLLEDGWKGETTVPIQKALASSAGGVYEVLRQEASFFLSGSRVGEVLAQTCGVDFQGVGNCLVMSRVAGVSASLRFRATMDFPVCQIWVDASYALYLWKTLCEIVGDLGGRPIGLGCFAPEIN